MAVSSSIVTVGTTATALTTASTDGSWSRVRVKVPTGGQAVAIGASALVFASGYQLSAGESLDLTLSPGEVLYGRVNATTQAVHVIHS